MGRLASFVAKEALMGQKVMVVRCEDMVISGEEMHAKWEKGDRTTVYNFPIQPRAPGDTKLVLACLLLSSMRQGSHIDTRWKLVENSSVSMD